MASMSKLLPRQMSFDTGRNFLRWEKESCSHSVMAYTACKTQERGFNARKIDIYCDFFTVQFSRKIISVLWNDISRNVSVWIFMIWNICLKFRHQGTFLHFGNSGKYTRQGIPIYISKISPRIILRHLKKIEIAVLLFYYLRNYFSRDLSFLTFSLVQCKDLKLHMEREGLQNRTILDSYYLRFVAESNAGSPTSVLFSEKTQINKNIQHYNPWFY